MSDKVLSSDDFGEKLYNRFPVKYREDDINQNYALMKYLKSLGDSGFKITIEDINGLLELCNPEIIPDDILPTALRHYGLDVDILEEIPTSYLRRLLSCLGTALISRGTSATIQHVLYTILSDTDMETVRVSSSSSSSSRVTIESDITNGSVIKLPQISKGVQEIIKKFIPFFQTFYYSLFDKIILEHSLTTANVWSDVITSDIDSVSFDGSHYVNLGIYPTSDWEISVEFEVTIKSSTMWLFGSRTSSSTGYACGIAFSISSSTIYPQFEKFRSSISYSALTLNEKHRFILSKYGCYLDNGICVKSEYTDSEDFVGTFPLYVGVLNHAGTINSKQHFTGKIYSIRVNDGNSIISYSPHIKNGVIGFIDSNSNFYPLQST